MFKRYKILQFPFSFFTYMHVHMFFHIPSCSHSFISIPITHSTQPKDNPHHGLHLRSSSFTCTLHTAPSLRSIAQFLDFSVLFAPAPRHAWQRGFSVFVSLAPAILPVLRDRSCSPPAPFIRYGTPTIRIGSPYSVKEKNFYHSVSTCSSEPLTPRLRTLHASSPAQRVSKLSLPDSSILRVIFVFLPAYRTRNASLYL